MSVGKIHADVMGTSDEDSLNDNASVISIASDTTVLDEGKPAILIRYFKTCYST